MDWNLFWNAFGAVGTTAGSLITAIAVVVAVRQYKQPLIKKLKISFTTGFVVMNDNSLGETLHCITVSNTGIRPIVITNIYFGIGRKKLMINNVEYPYLPHISFPYTLDQEQSMEMRFSCNTIASEFIRLINSGTLAPSTKIKILVNDTTGGEHYYKTGFNASQFAKYHD